MADSTLDIHAKTSTAGMFSVTFNCMTLTVQEHGIDSTRADTKVR